MIEGKTSSGFEFQIDDATLDDWEVIELAADMEDNPAKLVKLAKRLLGKDSYKRLKKHNMIDGRVSTEKMGNDISEILSVDDSEKKSSPSAD